MYYSDVLKDLSLRLTASRTRLVSEPQLPQKIPHLTSYSRTFDPAPIFRRPGLLTICEVLARQLNHRYDRRQKDVDDAALRKIIQEQAGKTEEQTNEYVEKLEADKRDKRHVY